MMKREEQATNHGPKRKQTNKLKTVKKQTVVMKHD